MQTPKIRSMAGLDFSNKRVFIRADLNVPVKDGVVTSDARIVASLPTIKQAMASAASVTVMSHLGRPTEGQVEEAFSLQPVARRLAELLQTDVPLIPCIGARAGARVLSMLKYISIKAGRETRRRIGHL